ncbi:MAG: hypothetical protein JWQ87_5405 [Candidatus Sulfotelmatobacter sp.]|nr:hypothetical protein [Candidatus Sulfotelmatobacter sp.]
MLDPCTPQPLPPELTAYTEYDLLMMVSAIGESSEMPELNRACLEAITSELQAREWAKMMPPERKWN